MGGIGWTPKENEVTTPKLPPPPPWQAQSRSLSASAEATSWRPSAVTRLTDFRLSAVRPYLRAKTPTPPPSVRPAMPTVGHEPPGSSIPWPPMALYTSIRRAPAPTTPVVPETEIAERLVTSMTSPSQLE